jgi:regulatory protein
VNVKRPVFDPYRAALAWLAARELTSRQIASRLRQRKCDRAVIDDTLERLRKSGALDDSRAAAALARTAAEVKRQGPSRVLAELTRLGVDRSTAAATVERVFGARDESVLIERALGRRVRGPISTPAEFRRLHAYLIRKGFSSSAATRALKARSTRFTGDVDAED